MACIVAPSTGLDLTSFLAAVKKQLPSYATPIFLRLVMTLFGFSLFWFSLNQRSAAQYVV